MHPQMSRILRVVIPAVLLSAAVALGASTDFVDVTVQGRLTDAAGNSLPDGTYDIGVNRIRQDGAVFSSGVFPVQVTGGLFNLTVEDIPAAFFDCPNPNLPCEQKLQLALVDLGILLPLIKIGGVGRAALASGLDGHVKTSPRQLEILAADPLTNAGKAILTDASIVLTDAAGDPAFELNTVNKTCNARGIHCTWDRNSDNISDVDFWENGTITYDCDFNGSSDYELGGSFATFRKPFFCRSSFRVDVGPALAEELLVSNGAVDVHAAFNLYAGATGFPNFYATGTAIDLDANGDGTREIEFGAGTVAVNGVVSVNSDGDINYEMLVLPGDVKCLVAFSADPDGDADDEFVVDDNSVTVNATMSIAGGMSVDPGGDGDGNLVVSDDGAGNETFLWKGEMDWDINKDGIHDFEGWQDGLNPAFHFAGNVNVVGNIHATGNVSADGGKTFVQQHPIDPTKEIVYVSLEGGEAGTYTRGSSRLENGVAVIDLPEHFGLVTNADGLTTQLTPRGLVHGMLYVESITPTQLIVKASNLADANVPFDFMINGLRKGFEDHQVIRDRQSFAATR